MDVNSYLRRINYNGPREPTPDVLRDLHRAHMLAVPFENLDIHLGRPIVLGERPLYAKIVEGRRGGFCYELNGLFACLLRSLGFDVEMLSAGVAREDGGFGPDFDHMALLVRLDERWLADVGFGDSFLEPLLLDYQGEQRQGRSAYKVASDEDGRLMLLRRDDDGPWQPQYRFTTAARNFADYEDMCHYHQTSPASTFTQKRVCTRATLDGRITLRDTRLIVTAEGGRNETALADADEFSRALRKHFSITLKGYDGRH